MDVPVARYRRSRWMEGGTNRGKDPFSSGKVATVRAAAAGAPNENSPHVASLGRRAGAEDGGYRIRSLSQNEMTKFSPPVRNLDLQAVCLFKDFHQSNGRSERREGKGERLLIPNNPHVDGVLWFVWSPDYSVSSLSLSLPHRALNVTFARSLRAKLTPKCETKCRRSASLVIASNPQPPSFLPGHFSVFCPR